MATTMKFPFPTAFAFILALLLICVTATTGYAQTNEESPAKAPAGTEEQSGEVETAAPSTESQKNTQAVPQVQKKLDRDPADEESAPNTASASQSRDARRAVALTDNYSIAEITAATVATLTGATLVVLGSNLFGEPTPSMAPPLRGSLAYRISMTGHGDLSTGESFLYGVPDVIGAGVLPVVPTIYYLGSSAYSAWNGEPLFAAQGPNISHSAVGYVETMGWTLLATGAFKHLVGRTRPYSALNRPQFAANPVDRNTSFFSGHSATAFATVSFLAWDLSDHLVHHTLESDASRLWLGRILPFLGLYGVAGLTAFSRIYDQQHFFSDVATGSMVGALIGNLVYLIHFDERGRPRSTNREDTEISWDLSPTWAPTSGTDSTFGVTLSSPW
jgi:membrane-associated phospholipid phosphatase